ncbi:MAG: excinuclease ABC subunit UvrC [Flavobacteriales bacterium]
MTPEIADILKNLPDNPGVYQFFDVQGKLIYVGKAKVLKNRVRSYFNNLSSHYGKTKALVRNIRDIKYILVESEQDALLLENSLIKEFLPRYNIMLKDDKTYPWICIKNERFPRVFSTRKMIRDGSQYFGPYASVRMVHTLLDFIQSIFPLRNCNLSLSQENIDKKKFKVCLEYHLGNCAGPCDKYEGEEEYNAKITQIRHILKGNISTVIQHLKQMMQEHVEKLEFEKAHAIKEKLEILSNYQSKSTVVSPTIKNLDVFSIVSKEEEAYVNYLKVVDGAIVQGHTLEVKKKLDESEEEILLLAIVELRERYQSDAPEIIVPFVPTLELSGVEWTVPQRGDKKKLQELSERNAKFFGLEKKKSSTVNRALEKSERILEQMKKDLRLTELPVHIECFDNSNIQGAFPVSACVVFRNAAPSKKDYRIFNIKTVEGPDDFASMEEVIFRRYKRMLEEGSDLPQLIVIDGGKGQLGAALESLEKLGLRGKIAIIGIAKRLEEIFFPGDSFPLYLDKRSETLKVIQHMRNEAHRFGITAHRNRRSKALTHTRLKDIPGVGEQTVQILLRHFKSVKKAGEASYEELEALLGKTRADAVYKGLSE